MRSLNLCIFAALLAGAASAANVYGNKKFPDYSMVLIGGGLNTCTSVSVRDCADSDTFSAAAKAADEFMLSQEHLTNIADSAFWSEERVIEQQQTLALLEFVRSRVGSERISERELTRLWRSAEIEIDGIWVSGRVNYNALTDREQIG